MCVFETKRCGKGGIVDRIELVKMLAGNAAKVCNQATLDWTLKSKKGLEKERW